MCYSVCMTSSQNWGHGKKITNELMALSCYSECNFLIFPILTLFALCCEKDQHKKGKWSVQVDTSWAFLNLKVELKMRHPPSWQDTAQAEFFPVVLHFHRMMDDDHTWSEVHPSSYDPLQFTARGANHRWMSQPHRIWGLPAHESIPSIQGSSLSCSFHHCCCYQELRWILLLLGE